MTDGRDTGPAQEAQAPLDSAPSPGAAPAAEEAPRRTFGQRAGRVLRSLLLPALSIFTALVIGGLIIVITDGELMALWTSDPVAALGASWSAVMESYGALFRGSIGDPVRIFGALFSGDWLELRRSFGPLSETIVSTIPLIFTGLSVALAFRVGLFNIGAEGQLYLGALFAVIAGFSFAGLPWFIHAPLAVGAGFVGGALWGLVPGILKARTGAHEVIVTIMMNFIAYRTIDFALRTPFVQREGRSDPISKVVEPGAVLAPLIEGLRAHWGIAIAIAATIVVWWLLFRSVKGFEFRAVGLNPRAARYAGMSIGWSTALSMMLAGGLAGLAGATVLLGGAGTLTPGFSPGYGFDGITVALVGATRPAGVVAAAFLFGALRAGATPMQAATGTPIDIVVVIQALVIVFIAAPSLVRAIYRVKTERAVGSEVFAKGWGS